MKRVYYFLGVFVIMGLSLGSQKVNAQCSTSWINASGGSWDVATNWSSGVPGSTSDACINLSGTYTVTMSNNVIVNSLSLGTNGNGKQTLEINSTLTLSKASEILPSGAVILSSGGIQGSETLSNAGTISLGETNSVSIQTIAINSTGTVNIDGPFQVNSHASLVNETGGMINVNDDVAITGHSAGPIVNKGLLVKKGGTGTSTISTTLTNDGTLSVDSGNLRISGYTTLHTSSYEVGESDSLFLGSNDIYVQGTLSGNPSGAIIFESGNFYADATEAVLNFGGTGFQWYQYRFMQRGGGSWVNEGLLYLKGPDQKNIQGVDFTNRGIMEIGGPLQVSSHSVVINEPGKTVRVTADVQITGYFPGPFINRGQFVKDSGAGTATISTDFTNEDSISVNSGSLRFSGITMFHGGKYDVAEGDSLILGSDNLYARGRLTGDPAGAIIFESGIFYADTTEAILDFGGTGFQWYQYRFMQRGGGSWANEGLLYLKGPDQKDIQGVDFTNRGIMEIGGPLQVSSHSVVINEPGKTVRVTADVQITGYFPGPFINRGQFVKDSGAGTVTISTDFTNEDSISVNSGSLRFSGITMFHGGKYDVAKGDSLILGSDNLYARGRLTGDPAGAIIFESGIFYADTTEAILDFGGTGFQWYQYRFMQRGGGSWANEGLLYLKGPDQKDIQGVDFTNHGTFEIGGPLQLSSSGSLINEINGVTKITDDINLTSYFGGPVINRGQFEKTGSGSSGIAPGFSNMSTGTIEGTGTLKIDKWDKNQGTIAPGMSPGLLTIDGTLPMDSTTAAINEDVGGSVAGTDYDRLTITGTASLKGNLNISVLNGHAPTDGDVYHIFGAHSITGLFDTLSGLTTNSVSLYPTISDTSVILTAQQGVPTVSGTLDITPKSILNGKFTTIALSGTDFAPDATVKLVCKDCADPENHGTIMGRIKQMNRTGAQVQFDLQNPFITGTYDLVITDPRGGMVSAPLAIGTGTDKLALRMVRSNLNASEKGPKPGVVTFEISAPQSDPIPVIYSLSGTAVEYSDFITSAYGALVIPAGQKSASLVITPLPDFVKDDGETVTVKLEPSTKYTLLEQVEATVTIADGPPPSSFDVFSSTPDHAGNDGTIAVRVTGQAITAGATAKLQGSSTITPTYTSVDPSGNIMEMLFDVTGRNPGEIFDLVITNGDGKTAMIPNALRIEKLIKPEISVELTGPNSYKSYLPPQRYYVTVTNRGNVDALAVPLSIAVGEANSYGTLVPQFDIKNLDPTKINGVAPGFPGWGDLSAIEKRDNRYVVSVIIPILKAGETKIFPFLGRSHYIKAWTAPTSQPMMVDRQQVYVAAASHGKQSTSGNAIANMWTGISPDKLASLSSADMAGCISTVVASVTGAIPGASCVQSLSVLGATAFATVAGVGLDPSLRNGTVSSFSLIGALAATALTCAEAATPWGVALGIGVGLVSSISACYPNIGEPDGNSINADEVRPQDPNNKIGPNGAGDMHYTAGIDAAGYLIHFENDTSATAPAIFINVTDQLDMSKFDVSTFRLGTIAFGDTAVTPPPGLKQWSTTVKLPGEDRFEVRIYAGVDEASGLASWQLMAIDPNTGQYPSDATAGFLPPNNNPPEGEGSIFFTVSPKPDLPSGTQLTNKARIVFDVNDPIDTPEWVNKLDYDTPSSKINPLKSQSDTSFTVSWKGSDATSGVSDYLIYVSTNDGPFTLWKSTSDTSATFSAIADSSYAFYSVARDLAGNLEHKPDSAETSTTAMTTAIDSGNQQGLPKKYELSQNYPNPFNPTTTIRFALPKAGNTRLRVYNILGQLVATLVNDNLHAGRYTVRVDARRWSSGLYFYTIQSGNYTQVKKMLFIK